MGGGGGEGGGGGPLQGLIEFDRVFILSALSLSPRSLAEATGCQ